MINSTEKDNIKFAQKVFISLIKSPFYANLDQILQAQLDKNLNDYFSTTRIFKLNDHFEIKSFNSEYWNCDYQFKIVKTEPETTVNNEFKINNKQTTLIQLESIKDNWYWFNLKQTNLDNQYTNELELIVKYYEQYHLESENLPVAFMYGPSGCGKTRIIESLCSKLKYHLIKTNGINLSGDSASAVEKRIEIFLQQSLNYGPCILLIRSSLNESQRRLILTELSRQYKELQIEDFSEWVKKTSGLYYGELVSLFDLIEINSTKTASQLFQDALNLFFKNRKFQQENKLNIEQVNWSDVGGLQNIKEIISDTILLPLNYPSLFRSTDKQLGITRSGILLYGPPGTGKTLLAKAISNECEINFLSVKGPELLDMYVGQTEQNVRNLFEKARLNSPCILFFDELDSLAPVRGRAGDSGGVMDRVVSQLLTEIDGLDKFSLDERSSKQTQIFLIGATNRPDLIDASLLRPGRFDKLIYVPIAQTLTERLNIFNALIRKLPVDKEFNVEEFVANKCPLNLTGADFYSITNKARQCALKRLIRNYESNLLNKNLDEDLIVLNESDFLNAIETFQPSLSEQALHDYEVYFNNYSNKNN